jgi:hypothetical protein
MSRKLRIVVFAAAALAAATATGYTLAARIVPNYVPAGDTRYAMAAATNIINSTSTTFVDIPNMTTLVPVPAGKVADLIITFSGEVNSCTPIELRAFVKDLSASATPSETQLFYPDNIGAQSHGFTFLKRNVSAGNHTVVIQWHGLTNCNQQFISNRSLAVTANIH